MYRTTAPVLSRTSAPPLGLARVVRTAGGGDRRIDDEFSVRHFTDLTAGYGRALRAEVLTAAPGTTFTALTRSLHEALEPLGPVELAIIAHATPDLDCRLAAATYLSEALPNSPLSFSVSDVGRCAPFAALRLAGDYAARHGYARALVVIADQATLPYDVEDRPAGDAAVALLLEAGGGLPLSVTHHAGVAARDLASRLADLPRDVPVVAGAGIDPALPRHDQVRSAPPGYPCTGLWEGLATSLEPVVLVEYDAVTGDLGIARLGEGP